MINPNQLFLKRLKFEWKNNLSYWKMVVDWTVALYILVPFLIFGVEQYMNLWISSPKWLAGIPFNLVMSIAAFFAWSGNTRLFIKGADQLFLWGRNEWITRIIKRGIAYSIGSDFILTSIFYLLLAPLFVVHYDISKLTLVNLFLITFISKIILGILKQLLELSFNGFRQVIVLNVTVLLINIFFVVFLPFLIIRPLANLLLIVSFLILSWYLINKRIHIKGYFFEDVDREQNEEIKHARFLLILAGISFPKKKKKRLRPLLFRNSNLIFKKRTTRNGLVEFCIKATLRNKTNILNYLQLTVICILIVLTFPFLYGLIWLGLAFILTSFVSLFWKLPMNSNFVKIFRWKDEDIYHASQKYLFIMTLPGFMILSFFTGYKAFTWIGAFTILPVGVVVIYFISKAVSLHMYINSKKKHTFELNKFSFLKQ